MGIRSSLGSLVSAPLARAVQTPVRDLVEEVLAARSYAKPGDVHALRQELDAVKAEVGGAESPSTAGLVDELSAKVDALVVRSTALSKKLDMAMGAIQAATAQLSSVRNLADEAGNAAQQAEQRAGSALTTAEAAADGISGVEDAVAKLMEQVASIGTAPARAPAAQDRGCKVDGCDNKHRARGFCGGHYQQWRRGSLDGFPNPAS